jgi:DNA-binding CsgD family transcriptional regulator
MKHLSHLSFIREAHSILTLSQDPVGLLRALIYGPLAPLGAVSGFLVILLDDGKILVIDSYGYENSILKRGSMHSVWSHTAVNDSIRSGEVLCFSTRKDYLEHYPQNNQFELPGDGFVAIPIWQKGFPLGAMGFALHDDISDEHRSQRSEVWDCLRVLFEISVDRPIWLREMDNNWATIKQELLSSGEVLTPHSVSIPSKAKLTKRQLQILEGLADGMTNRQIAAQLHTSESTVGKETIAIYRELHAKNRQDATAIAKTLGLLISLDEQQEDPKFD